MPPSRWLSAVCDREPAAAPLLGVLPGEGVGPEVIDASLAVLRALEGAGAPRVEVVVGGAIGRTAEELHGTPLPQDVLDFCRNVFGRGGAILNGPGGGRYVYDLRRELDLFLKVSPIQVRNGLPEASPLKREAVEGVDVLVVRENLGGVYQGIPEEGTTADGGRLARHAFSYTEAEARRFLHAAARLASGGELTVVTKEAGVPGVSRLWRECAGEAADAHGVGLSVVDVDLMAYQLVRHPRRFGVVAAPNLFGDILGDLAAVLLGSRSLSYGASFSETGHGVFQTNHGAAYDIAGSDHANPVGQILSLAALLRESLGLPREAAAMEEGIRQVWRDGWRSRDLAVTGDRIVGCRRLGELVASAAAQQLEVSLDAA